MEIEMGRPPIGKRAMTGAERVRRYRLKHGTDKPAKSVTKRHRDLLRLLGVDPRGLSAVDIAEGVEAATRVSRCGPGADKHRPQAIADWQAFVRRTRRGRTGGKNELRKRT
jgi:hypothetical protein